MFAAIIITVVHKRIKYAILCALEIKRSFTVTKGYPRTGL